MSNGSNATYQQQAYEFVKNKIINLGFKPGEYITDSQIAEDLNISRTPVREAFHRLENEELLVYETRRGWKVYALMLADINEIFDIKIELEGMIARKAAACTDEALREQLEQACQKMEEAAQSENMEVWLEADRLFHDTIFAMAANRRAQRVVKNLNDQWHRLRIGFLAMQGRVKQSVAEHKTIAHSILASDGDQAEQTMQNHLDNVRKDLVNLLVNVLLPYAQNGV